MDLADGPRPLLPDWIQDAHTVLATHITDGRTGERHDQSSGIDRDQAVEVLCTADDLALDSADADYAIQQLLNRGYLYEVGNELRVAGTPE